MRLYLYIYLHTIIVCFCFYITTLYYTWAFTLKYYIECTRICYCFPIYSYVWKLHIYLNKVIRNTPNHTAPTDLQIRILLQTNVKFKSSLNRCVRFWPNDFKLLSFWKVFSHCFVPINHKCQLFKDLKKIFYSNIYWLNIISFLVIYYICIIFCGQCKNQKKVEMKFNREIKTS